MLITFSPPESALSLRALAAPPPRAVARPVIWEPEAPEVSGPMPTVPAY